MDLHNKKIGIWGFGVVGQSTARFMANYSTQIQIMDTKTPTAEQQQWLIDHMISFVTQSPETISSFLEHNDYIIPSPGININQYYAQYADKWLCELDIFAIYFKNPIIAITGSVGKTSVTTLLGGLLKKLSQSAGNTIVGTSPIIGGNIGTCTLDFITPAQATSAIVEVSSFQIAYTKKFAPQLAIITNFSPNHLDWHGTLDHYLHAKLNIYTHQTATDYALLPYELHDTFIAYQQKKLLDVSTSKNYGSTENLADSTSQLFLFSTDTIPADKRTSLAPHIILFYVHHNIVMRYHNRTYTPIYNLANLPPITCTQNWLIIITALTILALPLNDIHEHVSTLALPPHRLEKVITPPDYPIAIYNDSKSTTPAATLNALQTLTGKPTHLFLGGLSKGIDREPLIAALQNKVKKVYCFGAEHVHLAQLCAQYQISCEAFATLEPAVNNCLINALPHEQIIFSPAGSSYDLFQHYEHRGDQFKRMVALFLQK